MYGHIPCCCLLSANFSYFIAQVVKLEQEQEQEVELELLLNRVGQ
jgi:hypothetical protein